MINLSDKLTAKTVENILGESKEIAYVYGDANSRTEGTVANNLNHLNDEIVQKVTIGDIVGNPVGDWQQGTVEQYVDNKFTEQNAEINRVLSAQQDKLNAMNGNEVVTCDNTASRPATGQVGIIYRVCNDPDSTHYTDYMWDTSIATPAYKKLATYTYPGLDNKPTKNSNNFVKSGGVFDEISNCGMFDLTDYNSGTTYADLSAALTAMNSVPSDYKKGGMTLKFVHSSDNKYAQYFLTKDEWSASEGDWEKINLEEEVSQLGQEIDDIDIKIEGYTPAETTETVVSEAEWYQQTPFSKTIPRGSIITEITNNTGNTYFAKTDWSYDVEITAAYVAANLPYTTTEEYIGVLCRYTGQLSLKYNDGTLPVKGLKEDIEEINDSIEEIEESLVEDVQEPVAYTYNMVGNYKQATMFESPLPAGTIIKSMFGIASFYFTDANGAYHNPLIYTSQENLVLSQTEYGVISNPSGTLTLNILETVEKSKFEIIDEEIGDIQEKISNDIEIICPTNLYAMVGKDFNLYYDSLFKAMDNGLQSPFGYYVEINCATLWTKSIRKDRCLQIQGSELTSASVGQHSATINVYNHKGILSGTKTVTINVIDNQGLVSSKNILLIGDSLTYNGSLAKRVNDNIVTLGGVAPNMVGSVERDGYYCEGRPGWTAVDFVSAKQNGYHIFFITISANASVGDKYTDGTTQYTVADIRIEGDTKSLRCTGSAEPSSTTGTLTKVSGDGDSSITYSNYIHENGNPLYNNTTELIDFTNYREIINLSSQFDVIVIMLGVNDCLGEGNLQNSVAAIKTLTEKALEDSPNCKIIVELTTLDANTVSSWQAYGSLASKHHYQERVWQLRQLLMNETFAANVMIGTCGLSIDRYYGYPYITAQCSQRITETEILHTNCVHPSNAGYNQIADCYVAEILS